METFVLTFVVLLILIAGMAIGVIMGRKPISGSCGGMSALGMDVAQRSGGAFDMAQIGPMRHVICVHRGAPAKYVVPYEKLEDNRDDDIQRRDFHEGQTAVEPFFEANRVRRCQRLLQ